MRRTTMEGGTVFYQTQIVHTFRLDIDTRLEFFFLFMTDLPAHTSVWNLIIGEIPVRPAACGIIQYQTYQLLSPMLDRKGKAGRVKLVLRRGFKRETTQRGVKIRIETRTGGGEGRQLCRKESIVN